MYQDDVIKQDWEDGRHWRYEITTGEWIELSDEEWTALMIQMGVMEGIAWK